MNIHVCHEFASMISLRNFMIYMNFSNLKRKVIDIILNEMREQTINISYEAPF